MNGKKARMLRKYLRLNLTEIKAENNYREKVEKDNSKYVYQIHPEKTGDEHVTLQERKYHNLSLVHGDASYKMYKLLKKDYSDGKTRNMVNNVIKKDMEG